MKNLKDKIKKEFGIEIIDGINDSCCSFKVNIVRNPLFELSKNSFTGTYNMKLEADKNGGRQTVYSGSNLTDEDVMYMLKVEINYFKTLKK